MSLSSVITDVVRQIAYDIRDLRNSVAAAVSTANNAKSASDTNTNTLSSFVDGGFVGTAPSVSEADALDNIDATSFVRVSSANVATVNGPEGAGGGTVQTIYYGSNNVAQVYSEVVSPGRSYKRYKQGETWYDWEELIDSGTLPELAPVAARSYATVQKMLADTRLSYVKSSATYRVSTGDIIRAGRHTYRVEWQGASTSVYDVITAGSVKLTVLPEGENEYHFEAYGIKADNSFDCYPLMQLAIDKAVARANADTSDTLFILPAGSIKLSDQLDFSAWPANHSGAILGLKGPGSSQCVLLPQKFGRSKATLRFGAGSTSQRYNAPLIQGFRIQGKREHGDPMGVFFPWMGTDTQINDVKITGLYNIGWYSYEIDNSDFKSLVITSCGYQVQDKEFEEVTYCRVTGSVVTAYKADGNRDRDAFTNRTNGRTLAIANADGGQPEVFTLSNHNGANDEGYAALDRAPVDGNITFTAGASDNHRLSYCLPWVSTSNGSKFVNASVGHFAGTGVESWVGCPILIKSAGVKGGYNHDRIASVSGSGMASLENTPVRTTTNSELITGVSFMCARPRSMQTGAVLTNDVQMTNCRIEGYNGIGMFLENCANFVVDGTKIHGRTDLQMNFGNSAQAIVFDGCNGGSSGVTIGDGCEFEHGLFPSSGRLLLVGENCKVTVAGAHGKTPRAQFPVYFDAEGTNSFLNWKPNCVAQDYDRPHVGIGSNGDVNDVFIGANTMSNFSFARADSGTVVLNPGHTEVASVRSARQTNLAANETLIIDPQTEMGLIAVNAASQSYCGLVQFRIGGWKADVAVNGGMETRFYNGQSSAFGRSSTYGTSGKLVLAVCNDKLVLVNRTDSAFNVSFTLLSGIT